jgi:hypothetical protein
LPRVGREEGGEGDMLERRIRNVGWRHCSAHVYMWMRCQVVIRNVYDKCISAGTYRGVSATWSASWTAR